MMMMMMICARALALARSRFCCCTPPSLLPGTQSLGGSCAATCRVRALAGPSKKPVGRPGSAFRSRPTKVRPHLFLALWLKLKNTTVNCETYKAAAAAARSRIAAFLRVARSIHQSIGRPFSSSRAEILCFMVAAGVVRCCGRHSGRRSGGSPRSGRSGQGE